MKVLVSVSSKHGSTGDIGTRIGDRLRAAGLDVDVFAPEPPPIVDEYDASAGYGRYYEFLAQTIVDEYDAFVIGSAIYMGRWMSGARGFIERNAEYLRGRPTWLFASGPIVPVSDPADSAEGEKLLTLIGAREHRLFAGRLEKDELGWTERAIVKMVHSPWGDYRPWAEIDEWADVIAQELAAVRA